MIKYKLVDVISCPCWISPAHLPNVVCNINKAEVRQPQDALSHSANQCKVRYYACNWVKHTARVLGKCKSFLRIRLELTPFKGQHGNVEILFLKYFQNKLGQHVFMTGLLRLSCSWNIQSESVLFLIKREIKHKNTTHKVFFTRSIIRWGVSQYFCYDNNYMVTKWLQGFIIHCWQPLLRGTAGSVPRPLMFCICAWTAASDVVNLITDAKAANTVHSFPHKWSILTDCQLLLSIKFSIFF